MSLWVTTQKGNLVNIDQCISVFVDYVEGTDLPYAVRADVVAGPANPLMGIARFADEASARAAVDAIRSRVDGSTSRPLDFRDDPTTW
ncbi:hypothetical protein [Motilibacter aurantiacus]|uniref:hypothetical protein n=1 Tax=Motilibacter aurantiacus TaxID=2714955 RepID=UPI0014089189|nr:hypothetical protein [Motilibacter aurantiacus]NHC46611.1 hypothetical protein [Motilibacter aurantiacus]